MSRLLRLHDYVKDVVGDGAVEPGKDREVLLSPGSIVATWRCAINVLEKCELVEHGGEDVHHLV